MATSYIKKAQNCLNKIKNYADSLISLEPNAFFKKLEDCLELLKDVMEQGKHLEKTLIFECIESYLNSISLTLPQKTPLNVIILEQLLEKLADMCLYYIQIHKKEIERFMDIIFYIIINNDPPVWVTKEFLRFFIFIFNDHNFGEYKCDFGKLDLYFGKLLDMFSNVDSEHQYFILNIILQFCNTKEKLLHLNFAGFTDEQKLRFINLNNSSHFYNQARSFLLFYNKFYDNIVSLPCSTILFDDNMIFDLIPLLEQQMEMVYIDFSIGERNISIYFHQPVFGRNKNYESITIHFQEIEKIKKKRNYHSKSNEYYGIIDLNEPHFYCRYLFLPKFKKIQFSTKDIKSLNNLVDNLRLSANTNTKNISTSLNTGLLHKTKNKTDELLSIYSNGYSFPSISLFGKMSLNSSLLKYSLLNEEINGIESDSASNGMISEIFLRDNYEEIICQDVKTCDLVKKGLSTNNLSDQTNRNIIETKYSSSEIISPKNFFSKDVLKLEKTLNISCKQTPDKALFQNKSVNVSYDCKINDNWSKVGILSKSFDKYGEKQDQEDNVLNSLVKPFQAVTTNNNLLTFSEEKNISENGKNRSKNSTINKSINIISDNVICPPTISFGSINNLLLDINEDTNSNNNLKTNSLSINAKGITPNSSVTINGENNSLQMEEYSTSESEDKEPHTFIVAAEIHHVPKNELHEDTQLFTPKKNKTCSFSKSTTFINELPRHSRLILKDRDAHTNNTNINDKKLSSQKKNKSLNNVSKIIRKQTHKKASTRSSAKHNITQICLNSKDKTTSDTNTSIAENTTSNTFCLEIKQFLRHYRKALESLEEIVLHKQRKNIRHCAKFLKRLESQ